MPHQCLKCGILFPEGTTTILRGCPDCRGTRFFFTQEPLAASEREKLLKSSEVTLREAIEQLVSKAKEGALSPSGVDWVAVPPAPTEDVETSPQAAPPQRVNFSTILQTLTPAPPPHAAAPTATPPPAPTTPRARMLPGNRLLVQVPRKERGRRREVQWEYEAPPATPPPPPQIVYKKELVEAPTPPEPVAPPTAMPPPAPVVAPEPPAPPVLPRAEPVQQTLPLAPPSAEPAAPTQAPPPAPHTHPWAPVDEPAPAPGPSLGPAPETIRIPQAGQYEIDVKRLLEDSPVVVQRDGTYLIHLPSLFDSANKQRR